MYPNLYFVIKDWFGVEINLFKIFYTFGIFVALSFIAAAIFLNKELKRKEKEGLLLPREEIITVGKPASIIELALSALIGFVFGYKLLGAYLASRSGGIDLQEYVFSSEGNIPGGLIAAAVLIFLKYREKNQQKLKTPEQRTIRIWPHDRVGDLVIYALIFGILGAKLFDNFENWDRFISNPIGSLLSPSGLTFYGGLICAAIAIIWFARKKGIPIIHLVDSAAPALMLAYAVGRIGCQVSGDGDWGIYNSAYVSNVPGTSELAKPGEFEKKLQQHSTYFLNGRALNPDSSSIMVTDRISPDLESVPHKSFAGPKILPNWFYAFTYPNNVNEDGTLLQDCQDKYCRALPQPVFPTPMYETIMCLAIFGFLWGIRRRLKLPGMMTAIYLIFTGVERFLIELIRVNSTYDIFGFKPTQAEIISVVFIVAGIGLAIFIKRIRTSA
jgi:prolipoprotein diacylglyceryltransferase